MKKLLVKIISFFKKDHTIKYVVEIAGVFIVMGFLLYLATKDVVSNVFGAVVGFLFSSLVLYGFKIIGGHFEDFLKINYDTNTLLKIYNGNPEYKKILTLNGTTKEFAYSDLLINENYTFEVKDFPEKHFVLDDFTVSNYTQLFSAHSNSAKQNFLTIRLDDFDPESKTFYLSRSNYFNHLITNRAVDFLLFDDVSLRNVHEYGPLLNPLSESKMSNHIGINALVFLNDGRLLVPRRKADSTISKNKITSSIAVMLTFPKEFENNPKSAVITPEYLLRDNILKNLTDRVKLNEDDIDSNEIDIQFLGFGQNIYEGGKPQFYFAVKINNMDTATYYQKREEFFESEKKKPDSEKKLDVDRSMYAVDYDSFAFKENQDYITFNSHDIKNRKQHIKAGYEMSYLCNLWHYQKSNLKFHETKTDPN
ncbi:MAG: hypothetical protein PUF48_02155 [Oscillospiraceae bacterium]|nr:hypothetical protein [Oscillospiraceae bacterium]